MKLIVKTVTGDDAIVEAVESDTVETVKIKLLRDQGLHLNEERLIYVEKLTDEGRPVYSVWNLNKSDLIDPSVEQNLLFNDNSPAATTKISMGNDSIPSRSGNNNSGMIKNKTLKVGWLKKRSDWLMQWRDRYIVLQGNVLSFAKSESAQPHGKIECVEVNLVVNSNCRTIIVTDKTKKKYLLQANSSDEEESWMKAIQNSM